VQTTFVALDSASFVVYARLLQYLTDEVVVLLLRKVLGPFWVLMVGREVLVLGVASVVVVVVLPESLVAVPSVSAGLVAGELPPAAIEKTKLEVLGLVPVLDSGAFFGLGLMFDPGVNPLQYV
jgi:hypothetical protein